MFFDLLSLLFGKSEKVMDKLVDCKNWLDNHTEVTMGVGIACSVAGTVVACKETVKFMEKKPEFEAKIQAARAESEALKAEGKPAHAPLVKVYGEIAKSAIKTYWGAIALTAIGAGLEIKAHSTVLTQKAELSAAYLALKSSYDALEKKYGETEEGKKWLADQAKGRKIEKNEDLEGDINGTIIEFNASCKEFYEDNPRANALTVTAIMDALTDKFIRRGHIFLNDLCRYMGRKPLKNGWKWVRVRRGAGDKLDFGLGNREINSGFHDGVDDVCRFLLKDWVPASVLYDEKYKNEIFYLGNDGTVEIGNNGEGIFNNDALGTKPVIVC